MQKILTGFFIIILILAPSQSVSAADFQSTLQDYQTQLKSLSQKLDVQNQQKLATVNQVQPIQEKINYINSSIAQQTQSFPWHLENQLVWLFGSGVLNLVDPILNVNQTVQLEQQQKTSLETELEMKSNLIITINQEIQQTASQQTQAAQAIDEMDKLIAKQTQQQDLLLAQEKIDQAMNPIRTPVALNGSFDQLLAYAKTFLSSQYVWGGSTPIPGFDCSGFVQYVYDQFGVKLNRVTWDQFQEGQPVAESDLKPGDLVFFTTYAPGASHVGIYVGNRMMIDDSHYGVAFDSLDHPYWAARYLGARRVAK